MTTKLLWISFYLFLYSIFIIYVGLKFINDRSTFKKCIKKKLIDFRYDDNLKEAEVWWQNIFKTRMPLKEDYN